MGVAIAASAATISFDPGAGIQVEFSKALAKSGPGKDGDGRDDDDDDDDDDNDDDDNSGSGNGANGSSANSPASGSGGSISNIRIDYSNGWEERIRGGRYRLKDPKGRTVADRTATQADYRRLREIKGK